MMTGTLYLTTACMSCSRRSLLLCTIWLMANGAAGWSGLAAVVGASVSVISASHSSSCAAGRAFSAGMEPMTPALHCAMTSLRVADDEQRRADDRQRQAVQGAGIGHAGVSNGRDQNVFGASAVTLSAPSTMLSRGRRAGQPMVGTQARGGHDLGACMKAASSPGLPRPGPQQRARHLPARPPGCRPASGRHAAGEHRIRVARVLPATKSTTSKKPRGRLQAPCTARHPALPLASSPARWPRPGPRRQRGLPPSRRGLAADQVVGLDRGRAFVDRQILASR